MLNLIIAVMSLALVAFFLVASYDLITSEGRARAEAERQLRDDIEQMARGIEMLLTASRDSTTGEFEIGDPGTLLTGQLAHDFVYIPRAIQGASWTAGVGEPNPMVCGTRPSVWICLSPPGNAWRPGVLQAMTDVSNNSLAEGSATFNDRCPDEEDGAPPSGGRDQQKWVIAMPTNLTGTGRGSMLVNSVAPMTPVVFDHLRPVTVRYSVVAQIGANLEGEEEWAQATLQIRPPNGAWQTVDIWRIGISTVYDREIGMTLSGESMAVVDFVATQSHRISKTGSISGVVPPGWQARWIAATSSENASLVAGTGQLTRFMGQVNPIDL